MKIDNNELYRRFENFQNLEEVSYMGMIPQRSTFFQLSQPYLNEALYKHPEFVVHTIKQISANEFMAKIEYRGYIYAFVTGQRAINPKQLRTFTISEGIDQDTLQAIYKETHYVDIILMYGKDPYASYLLQLKLMNCIVPYSRLGVDFSAQKIISSDWIRMLVTADVTPSSKHLYSIRSVYKHIQGQTICWLYTKGLQRCNTIELEMIDIRQGYEQMKLLMSKSVDLFLKHRPKELQRFLIDNEGMKLSLVWQRWESVLSQYAASMLGGTRDHQHKPEPSAILFAVEPKQYISPDIYMPLLDYNPLFLLPSEDVNRQAKLAISQWDTFKRAFYFNKKRTKKESQTISAKFFALPNKFKTKTINPYTQAWSFLVKLAIDVSTPSSQQQKECLWFKVLSVQRNEFKAILINQPRMQTQLKLGDTNIYSTELLTDWMIYAFGTEYTPDLAYKLQEDMEEEINRINLL